MSHNDIVEVGGRKYVSVTHMTKQIDRALKSYDNHGNMLYEGGLIKGFIYGSMAGTFITLLLIWIIGLLK